MRRKGEGAVTEGAMAGCVGMAGRLRVSWFGPAILAPIPPLSHPHSTPNLALPEEVHPLNLLRASSGEQRDGPAAWG